MRPFGLFYVKYAPYFLLLLWSQAANTPCEVRVACSGVTVVVDAVLQSDLNSPHRSVMPTSALPAQIFGVLRPAYRTKLLLSLYMSLMSVCACASAKDGPPLDETTHVTDVVAAGDAGVDVQAVWLVGPTQTVVALPTFEIDMQSWM